MKKTALLLIDLQLGLLRAPSCVYRGSEVVALAAGLLWRARLADVPVFHVRHDGGPDDDDLARDSSGWFHHPDVAPQAAEPIVDKTTSSSFVSGELDGRLRELGVDSLVIAGLQTDFCVDSNCRVACNLGYDVLLAEDAHSTYDGPELTAAQIIRHHNRVLSRSGTVRLKPAAEINF
ncbi:isochorismatase family protein [Dongia soli]|uniref:Isochorismatase family protein n=1 Tax=Dongia soli TaxID=600628 RepID=A0ABU5ECC4_9PROT|nr:isochorismatase family protein [Dongia soli]MDY0883952.1 isochorismatase family protein [Dongia soli]